MFLSVPSLLSDIANRLSDDVLPQLPGASWPASHVRSSLVLLAYTKIMLEEGPDFLSGEIAEIRSLLDAVKAELATSGSSPDLATEIDSLLVEPVPALAIEALQKCLEAHQAILNVAIDLAHGGELTGELGDRIRTYLKGYPAREAAIFGNLITMMPL